MRQPRYTQEQVAAAALALVDEHGFAALSMRRLAQELGAGTMTLYHYVRTKEDLVALMDDQMMSEILIPADEFPTGWRAALAAIARRSFAAFREHPWALTAREDRSIGPNAMRHFEQSLLATAPLGLSDGERLAVIGIVDDYVFGAALRATQDGDPEAQSLEALRTNGFVAFTERQLQTGEYPQLQAMLGDDVAGTMGRMFDYMASADAFEIGLETLLDGIEQRYANRGT